MRIFQRKISSNKLILGGLLSLLVGCEQAQDESALSAAQLASAVHPAAAQAEKPDAKVVTLADVISQSQLPHDTHKPYAQDSEHRMSSLQLSHVGRYYTTMSCEEALIQCERGEVQYILNLLPDGTAHRMLLRPGRVYVRHNGPVQSYRQDLWHYDPETHEVIVHLREGVEVFYQVDQQNNLQMELEKTLNYNDNNKQFFSRHYPAPSYSYKLIKDIEPQAEPKREPMLMDTQL